MTSAFIRRREALLLIGATIICPPAVFAAAPRRLKLYNAHTKESFDGPYRDATGPIPAAMGDLAKFLRDHHSGAIGPVYVETLDILVDVMAATGQSRATVLSAYRTAATNRKLADRLYGVAEKSQHIVGRAIDVTFESKLASAAEAARGLNRGGVGWYPNSHFLHLDSGPARYWSLGGKGLTRGFDPVAVISGTAKKRPFTLRERSQLRKALAKKQWRERK
jgi:uncharacterized protein YcbK (DUF882 family)